MKKSHLYSSLLMFVLGCSILALSVNAQNLLENPSFEDGVFAPWNVSPVGGAANWFLDSTTVSHGTYSAKIQSANDEGARIKVTQGFDVQADSLYKLEFDYRTDVGATGITMIRPVMYGNGAFLCYLAQEACAPTFGVWKTFTMFFKTHPLADQAVLEINVMRQYIWLDNVSVQRVSAADPGAMVYGFEHVVQNPVYGEVLGTEPREFDVFPTWAYNLSRNEYAFKFGFEYDYGQQYAEVGENQLAMMTGETNLINQYNIPVLGFVNHSSQVIGASMTELGVSTRPPLTHPLTEQLMLEYIQNTHDTMGEDLWGLFYCDEPYNHAYNEYLPATPAMRATADWITINDTMQTNEVGIDAEITANYGNGIYGLPSSSSADEPYNWIAFRRWQDDQLYNLFTNLQAKANGLNPDVLLIGPDEISAAAPRDWERLASTWDISTGQALPSWDNQRKLTSGFMTKLYRDLTFKPTAPFIQVCKYGHSTTPEFAQEQYSQVLRSGGSGYWINGVEWFDRELNHPKNNAPDRWDAMLELTEKVRQTPELNIPSADCAIFYSIDTYQSFAQSIAFTEGAGLEASANYAFIGPYSGSWFDFISERQILTGSRNLGEYKIIYIPKAKYLRQSVLPKLQEYVENGGILACFDPEAFSTDEFGVDITGWRTSLFGVSVTNDPVQNTKLVPLQSDLLDASWNGVVFPVYADEATKLNVESPAASVLMEFDDGSPALVLKETGLGKTLYSAYSPFDLYSMGSREWQDFFTRLQSWSGCATNHSVWDFQLPLDPVTPEAIESICLTSNNVKMVSGEVTAPHNSEGVGGSYYYGTAPAEEGGVIPFASGKLTNRRQAYETIRDPSLHNASGVANAPYDRSDWAINWFRQDVPLVIHFGFDGDYEMDHISLFASGTVPAFTLVDEEGVVLGSHGGQQIGADLEELKVAVNGHCQDLTLSFSLLTQSSFVLSEVEVWGDATPLSVNSNSIPYIETFESYASGFAMVGGADGWVASHFTNALVSTDTTLISSLAAYSEASGYPVSSASHEKVLEVNGTVSNLFNTTSSQIVWTDCMVMPNRGPLATDAGALAGSQLGYSFNPDGHPAIWHQDLATGSNVWTVLDDITIAEGDWVRLTLKLDYQTDDTMNNVRYFQVRLDGILLTNALAMTTNDGSGLAGGGWFAMSSEPDRFSRFSCRVDTGAKAALDDLVVTTSNPLVTPNGVPYEWLAGYGLTNGTYAEQELTDGDSDGIPAWMEWVADTVPVDSNSVLQITNIVVGASGARVYWQGGVQATQWLERCTNLVTVMDWTPIFTNNPPTSVTNIYNDSAATNREGFYRVKAGR